MNLKVTSRTSGFATWQFLLLIRVVLVVVVILNQPTSVNALRGRGSVSASQERLSASTETDAYTTHNETLHDIDNQYHHDQQTTSWDARCFQTTDELRAAVARYISQDHYDSELASKYGWPIGQWCVSNLWDFSNLFLKQTHFNEPLEDWDMSLARDLSGMFQNCHDFDQDLSHWDVSEVTSFSRMFASAKSFRGSLHHWDTSQGRDFSYMFLHAHAFEAHAHGGANDWDLRSAQNMEGMFRDARSVDASRIKWDLDHVSNTHRMFSEVAGVSVVATNMMPQNLTQPNLLAATSNNQEDDRLSGLPPAHHSSLRTQLDPAKIASLLQP